MSARGLIGALSAIVLLGCATGPRLHSTGCRLYSSPWSPWRELLGASVSFELEEGRMVEGAVTRVEFFPSTEIVVRIGGLTENVTMSFAEARLQLKHVEYSREWDWSRLLGKYLSVDGVECLATVVSLDPEPMVVVMEETGTQREFRTVPIDEVLASLERDAERR